MDPLSLPVNHIVGNMLEAAGRHDEAIAQYRKTLELDPKFALAMASLGSASESKGLDRQALEAYLAAGTLRGQSPDTVEVRRRAYERGGLRALHEHDARELINAGWDGWHYSTGGLADAYASLGQPEEAMKWLEKGYEARSGSLIWLNIFPNDNPKNNLRSDPRFQDLLRRIGLPQ